MTTTVNGDGSVTVALAQPIKVEGETVTSVTLRRPKGKEFRTLNLVALRENGSETMRLIGELGGLAPSSVDQMDWADINECSGAISGFFGKPRETGAVS